MDYLPYRWKNVEQLFYTILTSVDIAQYEIFCAELETSGEGGRKAVIFKALRQSTFQQTDIAGITRF